MFSILLHCVLAAATVTAWPSEQAQISIEELAAQCEGGKIDGGFLEAVDRVIREDVRAHASCAELPSDFFAWIDATPLLRDEARLAFATVGPKVASNLQLLREHDVRSVQEWPGLALAISAAWSSGSDIKPKRYWVDQWLVNGRQIPEMTESFDAWIEGENRHKVDIRNLPWQMLAHLADSLVPIEERAWAAERYRSLELTELHGRFADVPYTLDPKRGNAPCSLESFLEYGGPCTHNALFAGGVFDAFGVPSGWAGGPGHTYPYWFELDEKELTLHRINEIGNRNGKIRNPAGADYLWEDELRLLTASLNRSAKKFRRASLGAWAYQRLPAKWQQSGASILLAALREDARCFDVLESVALATQEGVLDPAPAGVAWAMIGKALEEHPFDLILLLDRAVPEFGAQAASFDGDKLLLNRLEKQWQGGEFPVGMERIPFWRARCLAARGRPREASGVLMDIARVSAEIDSNRFLQAIVAMLDLAEGDAAPESRLKLLGKLLKLARPEPGGGRTVLRESRLHVVRKMVDILQRLGRADEADELWFAELLAAREGNPKDAPSLNAVGGRGGAAFEDTHAGAKLLGLRISTTGFNGRDVIGSVQAIFHVNDEAMFGARFGQERAGSVDLRAPTGWHIIGLIAAGSDRCNGVQLVFAPDDSADERVRLSPWVGARQGRVELIVDHESLAVGVMGRAGADVDALGLILQTGE